MGYSNKTLQYDRDINASSYKSNNFILALITDNKLLWKPINLYAYLIIMRKLNYFVTKWGTVTKLCMFMET